VLQFFTHKKNTNKEIFRVYLILNNMNYVFEVILHDIWVKSNHCKFIRSLNKYLLPTCNWKKKRSFI